MQSGPWLHYESVTHALYHCTVRCTYTLITEHRGELGIKKCTTGCWVQLASTHSEESPTLPCILAAPALTSRHHGGQGVRSWMNQQ